LDIEEAKINKETSNYLKKQKKASKKKQNMLRNVKSLADIDDELFEEYEEINHRSKKDRNNAKTHKKRLSKLRDFDEF